jgi:hypothetical protein
VDLVLEEVVLEVAIEAFRERFGGVFPVDRVGEGELDIGLKRDRVLRGEVHFDDLVVVEGQAQGAMSEDMLPGEGDGERQRGRGSIRREEEVEERVYSGQLAGLFIAKNFSNHAPHG